jgi:phosphoribosylformylglycinamidine synthase
LAATSDCNSLYCRLDPREGGRIAVAEAARNLTCSGAMPLAVTDNLNFGNPYKPEVFWQLREAVEGIAETCRAFGTPVVGGNVSLYNESPAGAVDPTPTVAMVGLIEEEAHITTQFFKASGDVVILVGEIGHEMGASHFLKICQGRKEGLPPRLDVERELNVQKSVRELIRAGLVKSAHDCSEGGLAVALAECCFNPAGLIGAEIRLAKNELRIEQVLFNESQSRILISVAENKAPEVLERLGKSGTPASRVGVTGGESFSVVIDQETIRCPIGELYDDWYYSIERTLAAD